MSVSPVVARPGEEIFVGAPTGPVVGFAMPPGFLESLALGASDTFNDGAVHSMWAGGGASFDQRDAHFQRFIARGFAPSNFRSHELR